MRIAGYLPNSTVDGVGIRQVLFTQGCKHHCPGCQNPQTWKMDDGGVVSVAKIVQKMKNNRYDVTISGGDPFYQSGELFNLLKELKSCGKNVWVYTGFTWEEIIENSDYSRVLPYIDVLVDGRFIQEAKDSRLRFKGSRNQRIIDVQATLSKGRIVIWDE